MAEYPEISLQSQLIGAGLNPNNPTSTYVDFATQMAKNAMEQKQMEENLARARLMTQQAQIQTTQAEKANIAGYNPQLMGTMSKDQAKAQVEAMLAIKKIKVAPEAIQAWYDSLPELVNSRDVESFITSATKTSGFSTFAFTKDTITKDGKIYNVAVRRADGKRTDLFDPETGEPVFPDIDTLATTPDEVAQAKAILERAKPQEAGAQAKLGFSKERFGEISWQKLQDKINVSNAPYARAIGQASVNNMRADRALELLDRDEKGLTKGEYDIVSSDLAAIFKGGVPDVVSLEHQRYETLKGKFAEIAQYVLSKPELINTPDIKERLKSVTQDVKSIDNAIILNYMDSVAAGYEPFIAADPARFARMVNAQLRNIGQPGVDISVIEDMKKTPLRDVIDIKESKKSDTGTHEDKKAALRAKLGLGK